MSTSPLPAESPMDLPSPVIGQLLLGLLGARTRDAAPGEDLVAVYATELARRVALDPASSTGLSPVRDRLVNGGPSTLADDELVALVLDGGGDGYAAREAGLALSRTPLPSLAEAGPDELLMAHPGLKLERAAALVAAFELGRRAASRAPRRGEPAASPEAIYELFPALRAAAHEEFHVVMLNTRGGLIGTHRVSQGSLTACPVHPRDALRPAVRAGAEGVVFVHNHPSGTPTPSDDDIALTKRLWRAAQLLGIKPLDHVVVAADGYYSFASNGLLPA